MILLGRINPDEIYFEHGSGKTEYREVVYEESMPPGVDLAAATRRGVMELRRRADDELVDATYTIEGGRAVLESEWEQDSTEALANLLGELAGHVIEEEPQLFVQKILPFLHRVQSKLENVEQEGGDDAD